ncbi:hypothetical protein Tco_0905003 [Tanacetum coccineum]
MNEQSRYKQDKTITRQSINVKRHIFNLIGGTEEFEERDLNIGGDVESTGKTRRPQPRINPKNDRVSSAFKSSCLSNNLEKLVVPNDKSEVVCATCKQCLVTVNHDECVFKYVNGMNFSKKNQSANVSESANQKKHKANVKKSKNLGSKERLASPRPSKPITCHKWLPNVRIFDLSGKITESNNTESESDTFVCDNASASNPQELIRHF